MWYAVLKEFEWKDQRGTKKLVSRGELVDILARSDAERLLSKKIIGDRKLRGEMMTPPVPTTPKDFLQRKLAKDLPAPERPANKTRTGSFRVLKKFEWHDQRGQRFTAKKGELVDILARDDAKKLLDAGLIANKEHTSGSGFLYDKPAPPFTAIRRIGMWISTSTVYSGGRIHMYQYAWTLANMGADVWIITNTQPMWTVDYPPNPNLHIIIDGKDKVPMDLDLIVTDSKAALGKRAYLWKGLHPNIPFICFNFETPNWVAHFVENYAKRLSVPKDIFTKADYLIANSDISKKYLLEWLDQDTPCGVLNPAVNTFALADLANAQPKLPKRPYAVFSARPTDYKGGNSVIKAIWGSKKPFDLVVFGRLVHGPKSNNLHELHALGSRSDAEKFALMKDAEVVLAPSKFEGYGMVPGEALAAGTPCIVYDLPVLREAYGDDLEYIEWGNEKKFCEAVSKVIEGKGSKVSKKTSEKIISTHGMPAMAKAAESLWYHSIKRKTVSAHMICYWGFAPEAMESIYPHVDQIIVAYGPTEIARRTPPDKSLEMLENFPDPDNKIKLEVRKCWLDKKQMRQWCTNQVRGNYHLMLDGDEIWVGLDEWIKARVNFSCPKWVNFWHDDKHWIYDTAKMAGLRWGKKVRPHGSVCPHYRWSYWRPSYYWRRHPTLVDQNSKTLHRMDVETIEAMSGTTIYHLGHALPKRIMQAKHEFYRRRDGDNPGRRMRENVWHGWKGKLGDVGDGIVEKIDWELPDIVKRAMKRIKKNG